MPALNNGANYAGVPPPSGPGRVEALRIRCATGTIRKTVGSSRTGRGVSVGQGREPQGRSVEVESRGKSYDVELESLLEGDHDTGQTSQ